MGLKSLMARLQSRAADTPDTLEKYMGYPSKAPIHAGCTPDTPETPCFSDTHANAQIGQIGEAANDTAHDLIKPEPDHWRVTLAPCTTMATEDKFRATSLALDDNISANGQTTNPERWCWPHSGAMNERELDTFAQRLETFTSKGVRLHEAETQAEVLVQRDRAADDRRLCLECIHLQGSTGRRRCGNGVVAGIGLSTADTQLPSDLTHQLQRCAGFTNVQGQGANS